MSTKPGGWVRANYGLVREHKRKPTRWRASAAGLSMLLALLVSWVAYATNYVYDADGRLVIATDDSGKNRGQSALFSRVFLALDN